MTTANETLENGSMALAASASPNGKHNVFAIIIQVLVAALTALSGVFAGCAYFGKPSLGRGRAHRARPFPRYCFQIEKNPY